MIKITNKEFIHLSNYIRNYYGINIKKEKQSLITGRLHHVLISKNFNSFSEYYDYLISDTTGEAVMTLIDKISTNHTFFMREADHFYFFREKVLPYLTSAIQDHDLRIWCTACSTGEESYTLAMIIDEFFGRKKNAWDTKILATDICSQVLDIAKKGIYKKDKISPIPAFWKHSYFQKVDDHHVKVNNNIKNEVIYRKFNLMEPLFPFKKKFHAIFCRNVMIYFDNPTKDKLISKLYDILEYGGYLFVGHSESLSRDNSSFRYVMPAVYRKQ